MGMSGVPYFPLDVTLNSKMKLIEAEFGLTGFGVVVKLFQMIYGGRGYYVEWTYEVALLFAKDNGLGGSVVSEIVRASIARGIFDERLYDEYGILTSRGIQERYFKAVSRRRSVELKSSYLLVDCTLFLKNVDIIEENVDTNAKNVDISEQSKEEESKEEERKEKKSILSGGVGGARARVREIASDIWGRRISESEAQSIHELSEHCGGDKDLLSVALRVALEKGHPTVSFLRGMYKNFSARGIRTEDDFYEYEAERDLKNGRI